MESVGIGMNDLCFWKDKRVFVTGHTGFKGSWLCKILVNAGADVTGYALEPQTTPSLFRLSRIERQMKSVIGDIRNPKLLRESYDECNPDVVFHLAAQPIVRDSYKDPHYTYETNVMGTVNLLECLRLNPCARSFVNVTTDKVYKNNEWDLGYREDQTLEGFDPYSNSKACSELITWAYRNSFFKDGSISISTARAGNVIGGGDFAPDRIIPDCVRAALNEAPLSVRNPDSTRPYQHVLEPLSVYLMIAEAQFHDAHYAGAYNVGPADCDCITTAVLVDLFCKKWGGDLRVEYKPDEGPHEAKLLKLDCSKLKSTFNWSPTWSIDKAVDKTVEWTRIYLEGADVSKCMDDQIHEFFGSRE